MHRLQIILIGISNMKFPNTAQASNSQSRLEASTPSDQLQKNAFVPESKWSVIYEGTPSSRPKTTAQCSSSA